MLDAGALRIQLDDRRPGSARDLAARMQRAARAFGQQPEIVGVDAEFEIQLAGWADVAVERKPGRAGPQAQTFRRSSPRRP